MPCNADILLSKESSEPAIAAPHSALKGYAYLEFIMQKIQFHTTILRIRIFWRQYFSFCYGRYKTRFCHRTGLAELDGTGQTHFHDFPKF